MTAAAPARKNKPHKPWNPGHVLFDPALELLCCLWKFPKRADELTGSLELGNQQRLSTMISKLRACGFFIVTSRIMCFEKGGRHKRRHVWIGRDLDGAKRAANGYWESVYGNGTGARTISQRDGATRGIVMDVRQ